MTLDDDLMDQCRDLADQQGVSIGDAAGLLIRRGLAYRSPCGERNGFVVFGAVAGQKRFGLEDVKKALGEEDVEHAASFFWRKA